MSATAPPQRFSTRIRDRVHLAAGSLVATLALLLGTGFFVSGDVAAATADDRPNIVLIMTDDQTLASLAVMPHVRDLIGAQGTTFQRNFASYPLCCPSRATYLTGQLPHNHDVLDNKAPDGGYQKLRGKETLPVWLSRAGYKTVHIGKYLNGYGAKNPQHIPAGWQRWHGLVGGSTYRMWGYSINHNGTVKKYGDVHDENPAQYQTDVLRKLATDYIDFHHAGERPFFLSWAPLAPHVEIYDGAGQAGRNPRPAPRHRGRFADKALPRSPAFNEPDGPDTDGVKDKPVHLQNPVMDADTIGKIRKRHRSQLESLLAVDEAVKAIVDRLKAHDILSKTTIIFTSDNGFMEGQHRIPTGKIHAYNPSAHIPLLMRGPGVPAGRSTTAMVSNVDLAATVLDLADATPGITVDGRSLVPIAQNPASVAGRHLLLETGEKNGRSAGDRWYAAVRTERYLYVEHWRRTTDGVDVRTGKELYDQDSDPFQLSSKHADPAYASAREQLAARLVALQQCAGSNCSGL